jgi:hypothetical protein
MVPDGYGHLDWLRFYVLQGALLPGTGYETGTVSGAYCAYNWNGWSAMSAPYEGLMNFQGCYLTSAWLPTMDVRLYGYHGGTLIYSETVTVTDTEPTWFQFNFNGVDRVWFVSDPYYKQFVMDDFTYNLVPCAEIYDLDNWWFNLRDGNGNWAHITGPDGQLVFTNSQNGNLNLSLHATVPNDSGNATRYPAVPGATIYITTGGHQWRTAKWHQTVSAEGHLALTARFTDDDMVY